MSHPTPPIYLGTWADLINALLHNPFLGSVDPRGKVIHQTHPTHAAFVHSGTEGQGAEPNPSPGRSAVSQSSFPYPLPWVEQVARIVQVIGLGEVGETLPEGAAKRVLENRSGSQLAEIIDDICRDTLSGLAAALD